MTQNKKNNKKKKRQKKKQQKRCYDFHSIGQIMAEK
jgi:hypothetical protein